MALLSLCACVCVCVEEGNVWVSRCFLGEEEEEDCIAAARKRERKIRMMRMLHDALT